MATLTLRQLERVTELRGKAPRDAIRDGGFASRANRRRVYERAKRCRPSRWTGPTRNWTPVNAVFLNPPTPVAEIGVV